MNTRDPRDRDTRDTRVKDSDYRDTRYSNVEVRPDRSWLRWVIPIAIAAVLLPFLFHRGHRETTVDRGTAATVEQRGYMSNSNRLASLPTTVYVGSDNATLTDSDRQKLADVVAAARRNGTTVTVTGSSAQADAVRRSLIAQGLPESSIEVAQPTDATNDGRVTLAQK